MGGKKVDGRGQDATKVSNFGYEKELRGTQGDEARLVAAGIHSRRSAADELGVADPEGEWRRWLEEEVGSK